MKGLIIFIFCIIPLGATDFNGSTEWGSSLEGEDDQILIEASLDLRFAMADDWKISCYLESVPPEEDELRSSEFESGVSLDFPVFKGGILSLGGAYGLVESADFPSPEQDRSRADLSLDKRAAFKERIGAALYTPGRDLTIHGLQDSIHSETGLLWLPQGYRFFGKTGIIYSRERTIKGEDDSWYYPEKDDIQEDILLFMGGLGYETGDIGKFQITGDFTYSQPRYSLPGFQTHLKGCWSGDKTEITLSSSYSSLYWQSAKGKLSRWRYGGSGVCDLSFGSRGNWKNEVVLFMPPQCEGDENSYLSFELESCLNASFFAITMGWDRKEKGDNYSGGASLFLRFGHFTFTGEECWNYKRDSDSNAGSADQKIMYQVCGEWEYFTFLMEGKLEYPLEEYWEKGEYAIEGKITFSPGKLWKIAWSSNYIIRPLLSGTEYSTNMQIYRDWE